LIDKAKIVHGWHNQPIKDISSKINKTSNPRLYFKMKDEVGVFSPSNASIKNWVLLTIATEGIISGLILSLRIAISLLKEKFNN
jgi:hypothetical protein